MEFYSDRGWPCQRFLFADTVSSCVVSKPFFEGKFEYLQVIKEPKHGGFKFEHFVAVFKNPYDYRERCLNSTSASFSWWLKHPKKGPSGKTSCYLLLISINFTP